MPAPAKRKGAPQQTMSGGVDRSAECPGTDRADAAVEQLRHACGQESSRRFHVAIFGENIDDGANRILAIYGCYQEPCGVIVPHGQPDLVGGWAIHESPVQVVLVAHDGKGIISRSLCPELVRLVSKALGGDHAHVLSGSRDAEVLEKNIDAGPANKGRGNA